MFHGEGALDGAARALWQEEMVASFCRENGIACVSTRPYLEAALEAGARRADLFADPESPQGGHYSAAGNRVAFEALLQGLAGRAEADTARVREWARGGELRARDARIQRFKIRGRRGRAEAAGRGPPVVRVLEDEHGTARLTVRPGAQGATQVTIALDGATSFSARVDTVVVPGAECARGPPLVLELAPPVGDATVREIAIGADAVRVDLRGLRGGELRIGVRRSGGRPECAWLRFDDVRIE
jgi:hypothetical protein